MKEQLMQHGSEWRKRGEKNGLDGDGKTENIWGTAKEAEFHVILKVAWLQMERE